MVVIFFRAGVTSPFFVSEELIELIELIERGVNLSTRKLKIKS